MKFMVNHSGGEVEFEATSEKVARARARRMLDRGEIDNASLYRWQQLWVGDPAAGRENNYLRLQSEGWALEAHL